MRSGERMSTIFRGKEAGSDGVRLKFAQRKGDGKRKKDWIRGGRDRGKATRYRMTAVTPDISAVSGLKVS